MCHLHLFTFPHWLTDERSLTVATWGLVVATLFMYLDSRTKGKQQDKRWEREDQLRAAAANPVAVVEFGKIPGSPHVIALVYNLGDHHFVIDKLIVSVDNGVRRTSDLVGPHVVLPGTFVPVPIDCTELLVGRTGYSDTSVVFQLKGANGLLKTEPVWFSFYPEPSTGYGWILGNANDRQVGAIVEQPRELPKPTA